jgi:hypothetical protein
MEYGETDSRNGWYEYKRLVLKQLEDLTTKSDEIQKKLDSLRNEFTIVKVKMSMIGFGVALSTTVLIELITKFLIK